MLLQPSSFLHPLSPTEEHVAVNECNHWRYLIRRIHHLRGRPCPYHDRETPAVETWTPPLTIAESVVLRDAIQRRGGQDQHVAREPDQGIGIP